MRYLSVVACLFTACLFMGGCVSADPSHLNEGRTPQVIIQEIYQTPQPDSSVFYNDNKRPNYYTDNLMGVIEKAEQCYEETHGMPHLEFAFIAIGQDPYITDLDIFENHIKEYETRAVFDVSFKNNGKPESFGYYLKKTAKGWRIYDVEYDQPAGNGAQNVSMRSSLTSLCDM